MVSTSTETLDWCQQDQAKKRGKGGQAAGHAAGQAEGQAAGLRPQDPRLQGYRDEP